MKASLDTNVLIHFYLADRKYNLFHLFDEGLVLYDVLRNVELENHKDVDPNGQILRRIDSDINYNRITLYTDEKLKKENLYDKFSEYVYRYRKNYSSKDSGELLAIALAKAVDADILLTDDTKEGGPYKQLLRANISLRPMNFAELLIFCYLDGFNNATKTYDNFDIISKIGGMPNWTFDKNVHLFCDRFIYHPRETDRKIMEEFQDKYDLSTEYIKKRLSKLLLKAEQLERDPLWRLTKKHVLPTDILIEGRNELQQTLEKNNKSFDSLYFKSRNFSKRVDSSVILNGLYDKEIQRMSQAYNTFEEFLLSDDYMTFPNQVDEIKLKIETIQVMLNRVNVIEKEHTENSLQIDSRENQNTNNYENHMNPRYSDSDIDKKLNPKDFRGAKLIHFGVDLEKLKGLNFAKSNDDDISIDSDSTPTLAENDTIKHSDGLRPGFIRSEDAYHADVRKPINDKTYLEDPNDHGVSEEQDALKDYTDESSESGFGSELKSDDVRNHVTPESDDIESSQSENYNEMEEDEDKDKICYSCGNVSESKFTLGRLSARLKRKTPSGTDGVSGRTDSRSQLS